MRKITDIYSEYKIMPNLQLHHFRVAAVAIQICESLDIDTDRQSIIAACLLHDMGNIIKFKLEYFPEFLEPEGLKYWQDVQNEYLNKYGKDEHIATIRIIEEMGMNKKIIDFVNDVGFSRACDLSRVKDLERKICTYADFRVSPKSVVSIKERLIEGKKRYAGREVDVTSSERFEREECMKMIEKQIFSNSNIVPKDITDESVLKNIELLKNFEI